MPKIDNLLLLTALLFLISCTSERNYWPAPTEETQIAEFGEESGDNQSKREQWINKMHKAAPGDDWKKIEFNNQLDRIRKIQANQSREACEVLEELPIEFTTKWQERGSANQAGSVIATDYNEVDGKIYTISAGGTLWKGGPEGNAWEVVNQDFRFGQRSLKIIALDVGFRILSSIDGVPMYSDDEGANWIAANGISTSNASQARLNGFLEFSNGKLFCWAKGDYWDDYQIYSSSDQGENWISVFNIATNSTSRFALCQPHHSDELFLFNNPSGEPGTLHRWDDGLGNFAIEDAFAPDFTPSTRAVLVGDYYDDTFRFYLLGSGKTLHRTYDLGATWEKMATLLKDPWSVGLFISPSDSSLILSGEVDLWKSTNSGKSFAQQNGWADYYGDPYSNLHADMMYMNEFEIYGLPMIAISHHGGLSLSSDHMNNTGNISLSSLNVSQYYSVRTDPLNNAVVYAGSQDQGFQRGTIELEDTESANFDQVISGDYGHIVFSNNGSGMWTVYPGGWVTFYDKPQNGYLAASYEIESEDESTWLPALAAIPQSDQQEIWMAGGNINQGETGSYLIKLTYLAGSIQAEQLDYNFLAEGGDVISSIEVSPLDPNRIYVGSQNGTFFFSQDGGLNWTKGNNFLPSGHYLYGAAIHASRTNPDEVYYAGSGYSNAAAWISTNNGLDFSPMGADLPETLIFDLDGSLDDNWIFAATENGPYMYLKETDRWQSLAAACVPVQTYWSVEWLENQSLARFGTYGRGIWDLDFTPIDVSTEELVQVSPLKIYPNPATEYITIDAQHGEFIQTIDLINLEGKVVRSWNTPADSKSLSLMNIAAGTYYLRTIGQAGTRIAKVVKLN